MSVSPSVADGKGNQARLGRRVDWIRRLSHLPVVMLALLLARPRLVPGAGAFLLKKGVGHLPVYRRLTSIGAVVDRAGPTCFPSRAVATQSLLASVDTLRGVGSRTASAFGKLGIHTVLDLLLHLPTGVEDWRQVTPVKDIKQNEVVTVAVRIKEHVPPFNAKAPYKIRCEDEEGTPIDLTFFGGGRPVWLENIFPKNEQRVVRGKATWNNFSKCVTITQPKTPNAKTGLTVEPIYKLTDGITNIKLQAYIREALAELSDLPGWLPKELLVEKGWPTFQRALYEAHNPQSTADCLHSSRARERLAFDELLATMLPMQLRKARQSSGLDALPPADPSPGPLTEACIANLPFRLTASQEEVMQEIWADMAASSQRHMVRLLDGDVGSGKTVCAVLAMLRAVEGGGQAALLVPTEILVNQHNNTITNMCQGLTITTPEGVERPLRIEVLSTNLKKGKARKALLEDVKNGEVDILVGTHALLSSELKFPALGLVVVDEEHRFGVTQRQALAGDNQNVLYMSATPIPRTLFLACYCNMEVSSLERPVGSGSPPKVSIMKLSHLQEVLDGIKRVVSKREKDKVFWVLPRIEDRKVSPTEEEGEEPPDPLSGVIRRYGTLVELLGEEQVRMVHGKLDAETKFKALQDFMDGEASVLVSTSVIEVGVDVPDATVCVVENADMFGLSQLHQLRGRIGRSAIHSATRKQEDGQDQPPEESRECHCVLIFNDQSPSHQEAAARLAVLKRATDGREVAEYDLKLRGPGDLLGSKQSGYKAFRLVNFQVHGKLIVEANRWAEEQASRMVEREAAHALHGSGQGYEPLNTLLELFGNLQEVVQPPAPPRKKRVAKAKAVVSKAAATTTSTTTTVTSTTSTSTIRVTRSARGVVAQKKTVTTTYADDKADGLWDRLEVYTPEPVEPPPAPTFCHPYPPGISVPSIRRLNCPPAALRDAVLIVFDTETTTLDWKNGCIIQLAGRLYQPGEDTVEWRDEKAYDGFTNPGVTVPRDSFVVHGISTQDLIDHARPFPEVYKEFVDWIKEVGNGRPVFFVVHNADFDRNMLLAELYKHSMDDKSLREEANVKGVICSLKLIRKLNHVWAAEGQPGVPKPINNKLATLYGDLIGDMKGGEHHKANFDVRFLSEVLYHPQVMDAFLAEAHKYVYSLGGDEDSVVM